MKKNTIQKAINHLSKIKEFEILIKNNPTPQFEENKNYFDALSKTIIYQQLSGKVAKIIYLRFINLFKNKQPNADEYLKINNDLLREIGLSKQKISYISNLSYFFIENDNLTSFNSLTDEEIAKKLLSIKGIGQWTVDMFMMFTMFKTDILPLGDLGIKKAFKEIFNLNELPSNEFMISKSSDWKPFRTIASCYLWTLVDDGDVW
ncbi:MAG: Fe-S cluster assembly protein HesB [Candidatus Marinimicrobia bacterium]|nr:Fe-S cluster assembly protein HesB [Candidatus Neomarinimicrobiota bacterium]|tara:strand:- start:121 stop:735 length:615 start_codon:yes stop_codon:yes gene_type:complete